MAKNRRDVDPTPAVSIDAAQTGEPISKYIYGQFIEHLGRCIYGGIWAEMLEDRKFFYAAGSEESPWKVIGDDAVTMVRQGSYVGEHTPEIVPAGGRTPCGIYQEGLGLLDGNTYTGRIILAGIPEAAPVIVSLVWGDGDLARDVVAIERITSDFVTIPLRFESGATTDDGRLEIVGRGKGKFRIGTVSLMPDDNINGMRADTLQLLRELNSPVYRWPGGNFVSGYNWKDGTGDRDKRPPRKNPAWQGIEHNDFGIDEFIAFCRELDTDPYIAVNSGLGDAAAAAEEVEYANGAPDAPMGRLRAQNGHPQPYGVRWWGIGNEMYGTWQLGHMPLEEYVKKHNVFAEAMRAADPTIKLIGVGATGEWSETMLTHCAEHMDLLSEHFYCQEHQDIVRHVALLADIVKRKVRMHRRYQDSLPSLAGKNIPIAMDEWNYWYGPHVYGELGVRYHLKDALGVAQCLHEYARHTDVIFMANYAQTVNVIGCIKTSKTDAAFSTTGLALKLYRQHFGVVPVAVAGAPEPVDVMAAWTADRKALTIGVVNPTAEAVELELHLKGAKLTGGGRLWVITRDDPMAYNEPGKEPNVKIEETAVSGVTDRVKVPALSVLLYSLNVS
jgi:alpha-N-arabinofuranosidase